GDGGCGAGPLAGRGASIERTMLRSRLALKITLLIVAILIIGFGISTVVTIQRESTALVEQNKQAVRRLTQTLVASVEAAMLQERPHLPRSLLPALPDLTAP